mmetsp:Transcript_8751/g.10033  ORF Transcript_8751/g.10033 Transcript_8751/m.10033 type:complete len:120 (-) Transcript_8751:25-384(-)|eukprot:CAMPEP_0194146848 /NCGR_PEP_ID=MMETSP0152-20130528/22006_1 /TAXON_ID=1049557 /ORGANISM="Thalassiothrix antarctica, Strain L6-D1" /LENGTH=119 /DNA_ID=CAMNT_0038847479 /DNA_START=42 /DNA_END=401 /DNA_ORIENTATION=+
MRVLLTLILLSATSYAFLIPHNPLGDERFLSRHYLSDENISANSEEKTDIPKDKCPNCEKCDGSGRILGGIGVFLTWWPIKAYRPCPEFIERGGKYTRQGQPLDEIAFGRSNAIDRRNE